jgi:GNAT superfamily N-acetyltransferase
MSKLLIRTLDVHDPGHLESSIDLVESAFADPDRYGRDRIAREMLGDHPVFYRQFFVAIKGGRIVGVGGVKAADWAAKTHLLYLSAVTPERRGQGIGRALLEARIEWVRRRFPSGRILVSTKRTRRFRDLGFVELKGSDIDDRYLMLCRF